MQGASPLASPGAEPGRHLHDQRFLFVYWGAVPAAKERGDRGRGTSAFEMVLSPGAGIAQMPRGACLSCRLPALPLACFSAPYPPPPPSPAGKGVIQGYFMQGASPMHPRGLNPGGTCTTKGFCLFTGGAVPAAKERGDRGRGTSAFEMVLSPGAGIANAAGGLPFLSPADPAFCFPFCPPSPEGKDRPSGRGARTCAVGKSARTGVCVAGRTCNNRHPLLTIAAEYGTITHRKNPKRGGKR